MSVMLTMRGPRRYLISKLGLSAIAVVAFALPLIASPGSASAANGAPRILFQSLKPGGGDTLYTMRQDGSDVRRLRLGVDGSAISPDWSPDGRRVVFVVPNLDGVQSIWVADADGANARELIPCRAGCLSLDYPAWSPDGNSVAFTHYDADPPPTAGPPAADSIRTLDLRTRRQRVIARSSFPQLLDLPRWSPDGTQLVVQIDRFDPDGNETGSRIAIVNVRSGRVRALTPFSRFAFHPDWSSRGNLIVFSTYDFFVDPPAGRTSNIFTIHSDGSHERNLTRLATGNVRVAQPTFTPDGKSITFTYENESGRHAAFVAVNGGRIRLVTTRHPGPVTHPRLSTADRQCSS
jgi:Tol biopolymer transport system component